MGVTVINQVHGQAWILHGQHIRTVHMVDGRAPSVEEAFEIIGKWRWLRNQKQSGPIEETNEDVRKHTHFTWNKKRLR